MLFKRQFLDGIAAGDITLAFRRWKRPTVKTGGTLRTRIGVLNIDSVDVVTSAQITKRDATRAGYDSREELLSELNQRQEGELYRIEFRVGGIDPRIALRNQSQLTADELDEIRQRLDNMDSRSSVGPWTRATLELIKTQPGTRAPDLAAEIGLEKKRFKTNVRKLKELGLTESLAVGYRLSPRGKTVLKKL
ncbi:MAG: hypothetical protein ACR2NP_18150 [Pirellulaceae bacterium]